MQNGIIVKIHTIQLPRALHYLTPLIYSTYIAWKNYNAINLSYIYGRLHHRTYFVILVSQQIAILCTFIYPDMFLKHSDIKHLRILRIYSKIIETKSYYGPHSNKEIFIMCTITTHVGPWQAQF